MQKTTRSIKVNPEDREWYLIDAQDKILGRLCSNIAKILRGKHKPTYTPNNDTGDFVIVVNANKIKLTGKKEETKSYSRFSGYPSGLKTEKFKDVLSSHPETIIKNAIKGMLPHNKLGRSMIKKLKVYSGSNHPHQAQNPQPLTVTKEK